MFIMDMIAGFFIAAMTGLGIGGGGLLVIYLTLIRGFNQIEAQGLNLLFFLFASSASMLVHFIKRDINFKILSILIIFGMLGAIAGSALTNIISTNIIRILFGSFLIISGSLTLIRK